MFFSLVIMDQTSVLTEKCINLEEVVLNAIQAAAKYGPRFALRTKKLIKIMEFSQIITEYFTRNHFVAFLIRKISIVAKQSNTVSQTLRTRPKLKLKSLFKYELLYLSFCRTLFNTIVIYSIKVNY